MRYYWVSSSSESFALWRFQVYIYHVSEAERSSERWQSKRQSTEKPYSEKANTLCWGSFECEDGASAPAHWASQLVQANTDTRTHIHTHSLWNQTAAESNEAEACWAAERLLQLVSCSLILIPKLLTRHPLFHTIHTVLFLTAFYQWLCRVFSHRKARITEILNKL